MILGYLNMIYAMHLRSPGPIYVPIISKDLQHIYLSIACLRLFIDRLTIRIFAPTPSSFHSTTINLHYRAVSNCVETISLSFNLLYHFP